MRQRIFRCLALIVVIIKNIIQDFHRSISFQKRISFLSFQFLLFLFSDTFWMFIMFIHNHEVIPIHTPVFCGGACCYAVPLRVFRTALCIIYPHTLKFSFLYSISSTESFQSYTFSQINEPSEIHPPGNLKNFG